MKKIILILVTLVIVLLVSTPVAAADKRMVMIPAGFVDGRHYTVNIGESYPVIGYSYIASDQSLVQEFIDKTNFTVTFMDTDGNVVLKLTPEVVRQLWSKPTRNKYTKYSFYPQSTAQWKVSLAVLPPGEYEMHTEVNIPEALTNGMDCDSDGKWDIFSPEAYNGKYVAYIDIQKPKSRLII